MRDVAAAFLPRAAEALRERGVRTAWLTSAAARWCPDMSPATDEDYAAEFLDLIIAVRVVDDSMRRSRISAATAPTTPK